MAEQVGAGTRAAGSNALRRAEAAWRRFEAGARLILDGALFLRRAPSLWPLVLVPALCALVCVAIAASVFLAELQSVVAWTASLLPVFEAGGTWSWLWLGPATFFVWLVGGLFVVAVFGAALVVALLAASLASAPFLERLSWQVEELEQRRGGESPDASGRIGAVARSVFAESLRLAFLAGAWGSLALGGLVVPGAAPWTTGVAVFVTLFFLPLDYLGHAFDRRGTPLGARLRFVYDDLATMAGLGSTIFVACFVPGFNLLAMPALVTAATLYLVRKEAAEEQAGDGDRAQF